MALVQTPVLPCIVPGGCGGAMGQCRVLTEAEARGSMEPGARLPRVPVGRSGITAWWDTHTWGMVLSGPALQPGAG